jgi:hypothetical protein
MHAKSLSHFFRFQQSVVTAGCIGWMPLGGQPKPSITQSVKGSDGRILEEFCSVRIEFPCLCGVSRNFLQLRDNI